MVLWFHGTLGARRQFPVLGGVPPRTSVCASSSWSGRVPGFRFSPLLRGDRLGPRHGAGGRRARRRAARRRGPVRRRRLCAGLRALPPLVDRVATVAVLDGTVPAVGPEATDGGATDVARRFNPVLTQLRRPLAVLSTVLLAPLIPFAHYAYRGYARVWPEDDRRVLNEPEIEAIFVDDMVNAFRGRCLAMVDDARLLGRDWGFRLADVKVPVRWWHGDSDHVVPIAGVHAAISRLQDAELTVRSRATSVASPKSTKCSSTSADTSELQRLSDSAPRPTSWQTFTVTIHSLGVN